MFLKKLQKKILARLLFIMVMIVLICSRFVYE